MKALQIGRRRCVALLLGLMLVVVAACGSRLPYSKVVAENAALGSANAGQPAAIGSTAGGSTTRVGASTSSGSTADVGASTSGGSTTGVGASTSGGSRTGGATSSALTTVPAADTSGGSSAVSNSPTGAGSSSSGVAPPTGPATGSTVNVGQIGTEGGVFGAILGDGQVGAEIWTNYINQHGGLNGHKVNLITANDGGDPSTALSEAQTMVQQDHVIAFVANADVLTTPTIAPYLQSVKVPTIGGTDDESQWFTNPDFFPHGASLRVQSDGSLKVGIDRGDTNVGVVACVEAAIICSNVDDDIEHDVSALGGKLVYNASASLAQPDFTTECLGAKQAGVNNLYLALDPASIVRFVNDCANQDYHPYYNITSLLFSPTLLTTTNTIGIVTVASVFPFPVVAPATAAFDQAVQQTTGGTPNSQFDASAWVAGLVLQAAAKNLPASNPTPADVLAGLYQIKDDDFGGLTSPITYTATQSTPSPTCYYPMEVVSGGFSAPDGLEPQCVSSSFSSVNL
jgi:branched-chain amino acid transport system substrate-binding protein